MKRKGFTLIELLAVIVILSVIALIATPMILGVVETAKKGAAKSSALGYIDAVEKTISVNMLNSSKENIEDGVYEVKTLKEAKYDIQVKGEIPSDESWLKIKEGEVVSYSLKIGEYVINYNEETKEITVAKDIEITIKPRPTKEEANSTDTHKGIIYLDPTDLNKTCTKEMAESNLNEKGTPTEIKTGCMKWYIYDDSGENYTMILDHNTTARISWNDDNINVSYEESNLYEVVEDLKTESGWVVNPRLITAEEIATITGKTGFDSTSANSWYYLDSKTHTQTAKTQGTSNYAWLFDYTNGCTDYGCNISDSNSYGYWTSTTIGISSSGSTVWYIYRNGNMYSYDVIRIYSGIRPVITIPKSIIG